MDTYINKITKYDCFKFIPLLEDNTFDLLLTDPPYFFSGGYKGNEWDDAKWILNDTELKQIDSASNNKERDSILLTAIHRFFKNYLTIVVPKLKKGASLIIFNKLEHVEYMKEVLNKQFPTFEAHIFEWSKKNPSPSVPMFNESEYALIATDVSITITKNIAKLPMYQDSSEFFGSQVIARPPTASEETSYMPLVDPNLTKEEKEKIKHDTPKPYSLWKELIRIYSKPNDLILDTFSGSGTTALIATDLNRRFISCELNNDYYDRSVVRLEQFKSTIPKSLFI